MEDGRWQIDALMQPSLVGGRINHHVSGSPPCEDHSHGCCWRRLRPFRCGSKIEKCGVTEAALLNRERTSRRDAGYAQLIAIFVRHRAEIENLALAKLQREGHSDRGVVVIAVHFPDMRPGRCRSSQSSCHNQTDPLPGFPSGRLTSSNVAAWVLSNQDSSVAPQTLQDAWPVCGTKNFVSVRLYSAPHLHRTIVAILGICAYGTPKQAETRRHNQTDPLPAFGFEAP
jgi:hypothetical protein